MLSEEQIAQLRPRWNDYPERRVVVPVYPPLRKKRGLKPDEQAKLAPEEMGALPAGGLSGAPTVRLWSLGLNSNAVATQIRRGSPSFVGPALIHSITGLTTPTNAGGTIQPVQLAYDTNPYTDTDAGATGTKIAGTHLIIASDPYKNAATAIPYNEGIVSNLSGNPVAIPIGAYITLSQFYLGIAIEGAPAGISYAEFLIRIIENAPPESIAWI